jgi:hypothetical protein
MASNTAPIFVESKRLWAASFSIAEASRTDPTTGGVTIVTAGTNGTFIELVSWTATGTTTAGIIRMFAYDSSVSGTGAPYYLLEEDTVAAITPSATVIAAAGTFALSSFSIASGWSIVLATEKAEEFDGRIKGGDY